MPLMSGAVLGCFPRRAVSLARQARPEWADNTKTKTVACAWDVTATRPKSGLPVIRRMMSLSDIATQDQAWVDAYIGGQVPCQGDWRYTELRGQMWTQTLQGVASACVFRIME